ncbi:DUF3152 domain-containing protein [Isoptericola sp. b490]|uniref:DUF3152 domain-containing protein n=1 Tax=Actinotalea lenta TaxID=3064654 RepID=UPI002712C74F|nr:DUF3152 domain-containing protein [Isoptericola sp. b490]MDO8122690.1 DUF3152 domain-containing protein [Isoptericola sp. b490]
MPELLQHARPLRLARHARRSGPVLTRGRFGTLGLVPAVLIGLGAGSATGLAMAYSPATETAASDVRAASDRLTGDRAASDRAGSDRVASGRAAPAPTPVSSPAPSGSVDFLTPPGSPAAPPSGMSAADRMAGLLSTDVPQRAGWDLVVVAGSSPAPDPDAPVRTVRVEVEAGLPVDGERFATLVLGILNNPQGWGHGGALSFARTDGDADLRVVLVSPDKVDAMCAPLATRGTYSCGRSGHAAINYARWATGTDAFADLTVYRQYLINHEVGHLLGHPHEQCPAAGAVAPVMQQQTVAVAPCLPNGWPHPDSGVGGL